MTLGEFRRLVKGQLGAFASHQDPEIDLALTWALEHFATMCADIRGPRGLYSERVDSIKDKGDYQLPQGVRSVRGVERMETVSGTTLTASTPLTPVTWGQRSHADEARFFSPEVYTGGTDVYWVTHRTLHVRPVPSTSTVGGFRVWFYGIPPLPADERDEMPVMPEATRYVVCMAAQLILPAPPADYLATLDGLVGRIESQLKTWLRDAVVDIPTGITQDGGMW